MKISKFIIKNDWERKKVLFVVSGGFSAFHLMDRRWDESKKYKFESFYKIMIKNLKLNNIDKFL